MSSPSLLGLPPELRELILVALLVEVEPISLQQRFMEPAVSRVSRSLREEALSVLYHDNTFCIDNSGGRVEAIRKLNSTLTRELVRSARAPRYMVACHLTLTTQEPWVELSVGYYYNMLCNMTAKPLYEEISGMVLPTLIGPLSTSQRRKQLMPIYLTKLVEIWQILAARVLAEKSSELQIRRLAAFGHTANNHALQGFQMQLMLLEQQNKKRLLMARQ
ncbi:hypothetical protein LTR02_004867 [Friedmanniomyces endolithicus]|nr:hypothetical protein LTR03_005616 [Friedmanniomyces endolithicus]KAK0868033.1 hypothetical protein LTS02_003789 [Friedmanniomyces endolithicus]KAK0874993.1 hypothetical protein LTR87_011172 [Friedmanniomyces endolithicus]KAK0908525.1 hypothetical protein LTR02_004867 [Friedmanniomyces endolithicus]KAK0917179.1 hypothetical protein LTR57_012607 [Friedmanniomyces endolithicus]